MAVADLEKMVKIVFAGDDTGLGNTINNVSGGLDTLSGKVGDATQPLADLSDAIFNINAVLAALAIGGLVVATKAAGDFGDSFSEISTLIDVPKDKLGDFKDDILDYATTSTASIEDINKSVYDAISAGEDYTTALDFLNVAEQLGVATKADLNTALNTLKPTMNAYGATTGEAAAYSDTLFKTIKGGKTTMAELSPVLAQVTGIASAGGVSFSDLGSAIAGLTASGVQTSQAMTQIKAALQGILAPTEATKQAAAALGIEFGKNALEGQNINDVFTLMVQRTGGTLEGLKKLIPSVEGASAAFTLGRDVSGAYADALQTMADTTITTAQAYDKMKDNFALTNQALINNLNATLIAAGTPLLEEWGKLATGITEIFKGTRVGFDDGAFDPLYDVIEGLATDLGDYFTGIGEALPEALSGIDWSGFTTALEALVDTGKNLLGEMLGGLDLTKADDLEKAIQAVVNTFTNWFTLTQGLVEGLAPFIKKIVDLVTGFTNMDEATLKTIGKFTGWGKAINSIAGIVPNLTGALGLLSGAIGLLSVTRIPGMIAALGGVGLGGLGGALAGLVGAGGVLTLFAGAIALIPGTNLNTWLSENSTAFNTLSTSVNNAYLKMAGIDQKQIDNLKTSGDQKKLLADLAVTVDNWVKSLGDVPETVETSVQIIDVIALQADFDLITGKMTEIGDWDAINLEIDAAFETGAIEKLESDWNTVKITLEDGTVQEIKIESAQAITDAEDASEKIDKELSDKLIEIKLQGEIDIELEKIRTQAETLQTFFEWEAKVEIADIEAQAEILVSIAELAGVAWQSTGDIITSALGVLAGTDLSGARWHDIIKIIDREQDIREDLAEQLIKLQEAQTALIEARTKAIAAGKGIITITTDGLEPELEQVLYSIVQKAQIKANEEGFNALLGI